MQLARIFPVLGFLVAVPASAQSFDPSFDGAKTRLPDETAICSDAKLSESDQIIAMALNQVGKDKPNLHERTHKRGLTDRHACGSGKVCILDNQADLIATIEAYGAKVSLPVGRVISPAALEGERSGVCGSGAEFVKGRATGIGAALKQIAKITMRFGDPLKPPAQMQLIQQARANPNKGLQMPYSYDAALAAPA